MWVGRRCGLRSGNNGGLSQRLASGGENVRTKDAAVLHQTPEMFRVLLDGVFDRHPGLRGAAVELGAGWVPERPSAGLGFADLWSFGQVCSIRARVTTID